MTSLFKLFRYLAGYKRYILLGVILSTIEGGVLAAQPFAFKLVIDSVAIANNSRAVLGAIGLLAAITLGGALISYFSNIISLRIRERTENRVRKAVFSHLLTLSIDYFEREKVGGISERVNRGISALSNFLYDIMTSPLTQLVTVALTLGLVWAVSPLAGLIVTLAIPLNVVLLVNRILKSRPLREQASIAFEQLFGIFNEVISHISTVRSMSSEKGLQNDYEKVSDKAQDLEIKRFGLFQRVGFWRELINGTALVAAIWIVAVGSPAHRPTPGDILLIALYVQRITGGLPSITRMFESIGENDAQAKRLVGMLETKPSVVDAPDAIELEKLEIAEFRKVSFRYPGKRRKVLQDVSFKLKPGQTLALVGPSGTGKTTITKLLLRLYEPTDGQILINGQPIETFTQESVRQHMGVVMQDVALFNDTVEANLQLANPDATNQQIHAAARQAHADIFIDKLPEKYKTLVGERGVKLSGGEKQRVAIARAILKQPDMIILDEATSALDSESEQHVQAGLMELMTGRTSVVIAHRLSTIMRADQILVLKDGKVVERGTHETLSEIDGGLYARLHKLQTQGYIKA